MTERKNQFINGGTSVSSFVVPYSANEEGRTPEEYGPPINYFYAVGTCLAAAVTPKPTQQEYDL